MNQLAVAYDMTFANRSRGGSLVYARSLFSAMSERSDIAAWVISGPHHSNFMGTMRWLLRGAERELGSRHADILHCPAFVAPWRVRIPVVVTVHDAASRRFPANHPLEWRVYDRGFMPRRLHAAARVITGSEFARREVIDVYGLPPDRVVVVPYGVDARLLSMRLEADEVEKPPVMVFPGAPIGRKNLDAVLRVMAAAEQKGALGRATLEITGASAEEFPAYSRLVAESGLDRRVRWLGQVTNDELTSSIRRAALVVYPSLYEGFGFPPLEAMALGTPVVASNRGSLPEVLDGGALLVDPADDRALGEALTAVLTQPELRGQLRESGWTQARRFTWQRCAETTLELYRSVLAERPVAA